MQTVDDIKTNRKFKKSPEPKKGKKTVSSVSSRQSPQAKEDDILQSTLARFRANVIDLETTPPRKSKATSKKSDEIEEDDLDKTPKASKILAEKNVMTDLPSPKRVDEKLIHSNSKNLDKEMTQVDDFFYSIEVFLFEHRLNSNWTPSKDFRHDFMS